MELKMTLVLDASPALLSAINNVADALKGGSTATPANVKADEPKKTKKAEPTIELTSKPVETPAASVDNDDVAETRAQQELISEHKAAKEKEAATPPAPKVTMELLRTFAVPLVKDLKTRPQVEAALAKMKATKLTDLTSDQYEEMYALLKAIA